MTAQPAQPAEPAEPAEPMPLLAGEVEVVSAERLSPSFVRVRLGGALLADFGVDGPLLDQRFKIVFPGSPGVVPDFTDADETWFTTWLARPVEERGHMRTYTIRDVEGEGAEVRLVVDIVVHEGASGPGNAWALAAAPGDRVAVLAPRRGVPYGGIEFAPPVGARLLVVGDETALPAVCRILEDLPADARGAVFVEVPYAADVPQAAGPAGVSVRWLPREGAPRGEDLHAAVLRHLGEPVAPLEVPDEVDEDLWETPTYSSSGEEIGGLAGAAGLEGLYAWIAGEAGVVTALRRHLVRDLGVDRRQVAFMGYWREGVSMRS